MTSPGLSSNTAVYLLTIIFRAAIIERHPEYEEKVAELFAPSITGVPLLVKLIYELYKVREDGHTGIQRLFRATRTTLR